jgi:hypothetical protein
MAAESGASIRRVVIRVLRDQRGFAFLLVEGNDATAHGGGKHVNESHVHERGVYFFLRLR